MNITIQDYHQDFTDAHKEICVRLMAVIQSELPMATSKIWHRHPVWFLDDNPIVGYHLLKAGVRLLFWSGQSFDQPILQPEGSFKAASILFQSAEQIPESDLRRCLQISTSIQWDYKNIVKRRGQLIRL